MFCPKCGKPDQTSETYCRQCGTFLPDLTKPLKRPIAPEVHVRANTVLSAMTIVTSFTLSILLFSLFLGRAGTPPIIYITAGLLTAMGFWHVQTLWRTLLLRKHFKKGPRSSVQNEIEPDRAVETDKLLQPPNFDDHVPASVTDRTTTLLESKKQSAQPEQ